MNNSETKYRTIDLFPSCSQIVWISVLFEEEEEGEEKKDDFRISFQMIKNYKIINRSFFYEKIEEPVYPFRTV